MKNTNNDRLSCARNAVAGSLTGVLLLGACATQALAATEAELNSRIAELEEQLKGAQKELADIKAPIIFTVGDGELIVGGAMRVNYAVGDYPADADGDASRAWEDDGNFALDTFRINMDYTNGPYVAKLEYRWYNGYNFLHTGWVGYNFEDERQVQVGVNRVPFGPGPYGVSQSWFFDQHYYVGLSDDMDLGVKYSMPAGDWAWDFGYYYTDEASYRGSSRDSARYSYDIVNESGTGYEERNQFNLRGIYTFPDAQVATDLGFSLQYGDLESQGTQDDGEHYAASVHMVNSWDNLKLATQLTRYVYDVDAAQPLGTDTRVQFGAYDFPSTAAAEAWIPAVSLSYYYPTPKLAWLDYIVPYVEYSNIIKDESGFNDSELFILGAAWGRGGWYIYTDLAFSNGNEFIGGDTPFGDRLGANANDDWQTRFNINFGYYF